MGFTNRATTLALCALAGWAAGCGDDEPAPVKDAGVVEEGLPTKAECLLMAEEMMSAVPEIDCLCEHCVQQISDCQADEGCREIQDCSTRTGCRGTGCYFGNTECMAIIDKWGSTSLSTTLAQQLQDCLDLSCGTGMMDSCPMESVTAMGMTVGLPGCCTADNLCGLMVPIMNLGCLERSLVGASTGSMLEQMTCDGSPLPIKDAGSDDDAGAGDDAGR